MKRTVLFAPLTRLVEKLKEVSAAVVRRVMKWSMQEEIIHAKVRT